MGGAPGSDVYNMFTAAVSAATGIGATSGPQAGGPQAPSERVTFLAAQREKLTTLLSALEREETQLRAVVDASPQSSSSASGGGLTKSRSEADFEKLEAESGAEEDMDETGVRRRGPATPVGGSWMPWGWGGAGGSGGGSDVGKSSGLEQ